MNPAKRQLVVVVLLALGGAAVAGERFTAIPWPKEGKPGGFMGNVSLAKLDAASAEIILLNAGREGKARQGVGLKSAKDACAYLSRNLNMAVAPKWVAAYRGRPTAYYIFPFRGKRVARATGISRGMVLSERGQMRGYQVCWAFFDRLDAALAADLPTPMLRLSPYRKWAGELDKLPTGALDVEQRNWHRKFVDLWKSIASLRASGFMCSRPCVFEWHLRTLLETETHRNAPNRIAGAVPARTLRMNAWDATVSLYQRGNRPNIDPPAFRHYLMTVKAPTWCPSIRYVAAGVLAGEGHSEGMRVLVEGARLALGKPRDRRFRAWALREAAAGAHTEEALSVWNIALGDKDEKVRLWAVNNLAHIKTDEVVPLPPFVKTDRATRLLITALNDKSYPVRRSAAITLMKRDRKEATPVLQEILTQELGGYLERDAATLAPVCCKLEQWGVQGVPWNKIECHLAEKAKKNASTCRLAVTIAGQCLAARREEKSVPFLKDVMRHKNEWLALHAARTLVRNGSALGLEQIRRYMASAENRAGSSSPYECLKALAEFMRHPRCTVQNRKAALRVARAAFERRDALFRSYSGYLLDPFAEMGALHRVKTQGDTLHVEEFIAVPYDMKWGRPNLGLVMGRLCKARLRSVLVSAEQQGIDLPETWLMKYEGRQGAILSKLAESGERATAESAKYALRKLEEWTWGRRPARADSLLAEAVQAFPPGKGIAPDALYKHPAGEALLNVARRGFPALIAAGRFGKSLPVYNLDTFERFKQMTRGPRTRAAYNAYVKAAGDYGRRRCELVQKRWIIRLVAKKLGRTIDAKGKTP